MASAGFQKVLTLLSVHVSHPLAQAVAAKRDQASSKKSCKVYRILPPPMV